MGASTLSLQPKRRPDRPFRRLGMLYLVAGLPAGIGREPRTSDRALLRDVSQPLERDFLAHSKGPRLSRPPNSGSARDIFANW